MSDTNLTASLRTELTVTLHAVLEEVEIPVVVELYVAYDPPEYEGNHILSAGGWEITPTAMDEYWQPYVEQLSARFWIDFAGLESIGEED